jgi:DNA transformation protein
MAVSPDYKAFLKDQFERFGPIAIRPMFGGAGIFRDGVMFGLVAYETLYLKVGDENRNDFDRQGMKPFTYHGKTKPVSLGYYEVPVDILEDPRELQVWAEKAFTVALAAAREKTLKKKKTLKP